MQKHIIYQWFNITVDIRHVRTKKKKKHNRYNKWWDKKRGERCKDEMHNEKKDKVYVCL